MRYCVKDSLRKGIWLSLIAFLFLCLGGSEENSVTPISLKKQNEEITFTSQGVSYIKYKKEIGGEVKKKVDVDYSDIYELMVRDKTIEASGDLSYPGAEAAMSQKTWYQIEIKVNYYDNSKKKKLKFIINVSDPELGQDLRTKLREIVPISLIPKHNLSEVKEFGFSAWHN